MEQASPCPPPQKYQWRNPPLANPNLQPDVPDLSPAVPLLLTCQALLHQLLQWQADGVVLHARRHDVRRPPAVPRPGLAFTEVPAGGVDHHVVCLKRERQRGKGRPRERAAPFVFAHLCGCSHLRAPRGKDDVLRPASHHPRQALPGAADELLRLPACGMRPGSSSTGSRGHGARPARGGEPRHAAAAAPLDPYLQGGSCWGCPRPAAWHPARPGPPQGPGGWWRCGPGRSSCGGRRRVRGRGGGGSRGDGTGQPGASPLRRVAPRLRRLCPGAHRCPHRRPPAAAPSLAPQGTVVRAPTAGPGSSPARPPASAPPVSSLLPARPPLCPPISSLSLPSPTPHGSHQSAPSPLPHNNSTRRSAPSFLRSLPP